MSAPSRRALSIALLVALAAAHAPGPYDLGGGARGRGLAFAGPHATPACCAGRTCCRPGHDCATHGGCGTGTIAGASAPHRLCLAVPGCGADQPIPAPHVFDPMLPGVATTIVAALESRRIGTARVRVPRGASPEPRVPPPRA